MKKRYLILAIVGLFALAFSSFVKGTYDSSLYMSAPENADLNLDTSVLTSKSAVIFDSPQHQDRVRSPLVVKGRARQDWFMVGWIPVALMDSSGTLVASGRAVADGYIPQGAFTPFTVTLTYSPDAVNKGERGYLVLKKVSTDLSVTDSKAIEIEF